MPGTVLSWRSDRKTSFWRNWWRNRAIGCANKCRTQGLCSSAKSEWSALDLHFLSCGWGSKSEIPKVSQKWSFLSGVWKPWMVHQIGNVGRACQEEGVARAPTEPELAGTFVNCTRWVNGALARTSPQPGTHQECWVVEVWLTICFQPLSPFFVPWIFELRAEWGGRVNFNWRAVSASRGERDSWQLP